jgi:hypothetical protein
MRAHLRYLRYVLRHKWFVAVECFRRGLAWRGLAHDWHKCLPSEWFAYVRHFYGPKPAVDDDGMTHLTEADSRAKRAFDNAWLRHQKRSDHHWQWWVLREDSPAPWCVQAHQPEFGPFHLGTNAGHIRIAIPQEQCDWPVDTEYAHARYMCERLNAAGVLAPKLLPMSSAARTEMLCDWIGAGLAITGKRDVTGWYAKNRRRILLHPETRAWIEGEIAKEAGPHAP